MLNFHFQGSLNASASMDPDFVSTDGMSFAWYCRDVDDDEFLLSSLTHEVLLSFPQANDNFSPPSFNVRKKYHIVLRKIFS